jgi:hypothetical protein
MGEGQFIIEAETEEEAIELAQLLLDCIDSAVAVHEAADALQEAAAGVVVAAKALEEVCEVFEG